MFFRLISLHMSMKSVEEAAYHPLPQVRWSRWQLVTLQQSSLLWWLDDVIQTFTVWRTRSAAAWNLMWVNVCVCMHVYLYVRVLSLFFIVFVLVQFSRQHEIMWNNTRQSRLFFSTGKKNNYPSSYFTRSNIVQCRNNVCELATTQTDFNTRVKCGRLRRPPDWQIEAWGWTSGQRGFSCRSAEVERKISRSSSSFYGPFLEVATRKCCQGSPSF